MDKETWLDIKRRQIELYRNRAAFHKKKRATLALIYVIGGILAVILPWVMFMEGNFLIALGSLILIPVSILVWKISTRRQGYKDSNTIADEWAIMKALRRLIWASSTETHGILQATSDLAQQNPVVFERYLRKKKISKKK